MMQNILYWLREQFFPGASEPETDLRQSGVRVRPPAERDANGAARPRPTAVPQQAQAADLRFDPELGGRIEDSGPGKNVLMRSKYLREDTGTHEVLKIIDESILDNNEEETGFDPYNTGQFDRSRNWNSRSRK